MGQALTCTQWPDRNSWRLAARQVDTDSVGHVLCKKAEELDVVQLILNHGAVQGVLDRSVLSDLETCQHLVTLIKKGYVNAS